MTEAGGLLHPLRDQLVGGVALGLQLAVRPEDLEVRDGVEIVLPGHRRLPVNALHAGSVMSTLTTAMSSRAVCSFAGGERWRGRAAVFAVEIDDRRLTRHQISADRDLLAPWMCAGAGPSHAGRGGSGNGRLHGRFFLITKV